MKILHTADWHLGKRLQQFERLPEQRAVLEEIVEIAEREEVDLVLIAGDLYDVPNPAHEVQELFYRTLRRLANDGKRPVVAIAGNHDSPDLIGAPDPLARECGIILLGYPHAACPPFRLPTGLEVRRSEPAFLELLLPGTEVPVRILSTPFANEQRLRKYLGADQEEGMREVLHRQWSALADRYCTDKGINLLTAHLFVAEPNGRLPEEPEGEKPIHVGTASLVYPELIPPQVQYAALGHLHRSQVVRQKDPMVAYSGSPLGFSFSEAGQEKGVHLVDLEPGQPPEMRFVRLESGRSLARKTFTAVPEAVEWLEANDQLLVELTLRTEHYLKAEEIRRLREATDFLLQIIPEPTGEQAALNPQSNISLTQAPEELFIAYFRQQKEQDPSSEILDLFRELMTQKDA